MSAHPQTLGELIGSQLRWLRLEAGLTQLELARRLGSHRPIVSRTERGAHSFELDTVARYAAALGVRVSAVLCVLDDYEVLPGGALRPRANVEKARAA